MTAQIQQVREDADRLVELAVRADNEEAEVLALRIRDTADTLLKE